MKSTKNNHLVISLQIVFVFSMVLCVFSKTILDYTVEFNKIQTELTSDIDDSDSENDSEEELEEFYFTNERNKPSSVDFWYPLQVSRFHNPKVLSKYFKKEIIPPDLMI